MAVTTTNIKSIGSVVPSDDDHISINTVLSTKTVKINCRTYTVAASIVGCQIKPRAGVAMVNDCIGLELEPGVDAGFASTQGIVALKANPIYRGSLALPGGNIDGDVRGVECQLGGNSFGGAGGSAWTSTRTIGGTMSVIKAVNDVHAAAVTGGIYPIYVPAVGGGNKAWSGFAKLPNGEMSSYRSGGYTAAGTVKFWLKMDIGGQPVYFLGYDTIPTNT